MLPVLCIMSFVVGSSTARFFKEDSDLDDFIERLETILGATKTLCYALAFLYFCPVWTILARRLR